MDDRTASIYRGAFGMSPTATAAALTTKERNKLHATDFALPETREYPIDTIKRARNALTRVSQNGSPADIQKVREAVRRRWPSVQVAGN